MTENPFEIPQTLRDVSEQNLKQVRAAYEQLMDFVNKSMDAWMGAHPMAAVFKEVQGRAMQIAKENAASVFTFAGKINNARTPQDIVTLQTQFAQDRMQALVADGRTGKSAAENLRAIARRLGQRCWHTALAVDVVATL